MAGSASPVERGDIQAVGRAAQVLRLFSHDTPELTVAVAAERLDLNRTTAHRYFNSMVVAGLLERVPGRGTFAPSGILLQLGALALGRRAVMEVAPPHMRGLSDTTHTTSVLSLWSAYGAVVSLVHEDTTLPVRLTVRVGTQLELDAAQSLVFLAFLADRLQVDRLLATQAHRERLRLQERIATVRDAGLAVTTIEDIGFAAVAVPVFDGSGICATLALIGTARVLSTASERWDGLRTTAGDLSRELGGTAFSRDA